MISVVDGSPQLAKIIAQMGGASGLADAFLSAMLGLFGLLSAVFMVQVVQRLRSEETSQRVEPLLATGVGRVRLAVSYVVVAAGGGAAIMVASGVMTGLGFGLRSGDVGTQLPRVLAAALAQVPAAWVVAAVALALFGLVPALTQVGWAVLVVCFLLGQVGPTLRLPQWLLDVSPFTHTPKMPVHASGAAIGWLLVVSAVCVVAGLAGFRRRDVG
jgi:ABC-2 type transport system permease protein